MEAQSLQHPFPLTDCNPTACISAVESSWAPEPVLPKISGEQEAQPEPCFAGGTTVHWHTGVCAQQCQGIPENRNILFPVMGNKAQGRGEISLCRN